MPAVRTLLVDDSPQFLKAMTQFLSTVPQIEIVGQVQSGCEALAQTKMLGPDLVLMDIVMRGMDGLEATRQLKAQVDAPRVAILTLHDSPAYRDAARSAGADFFIPKSNLVDELFRLISYLLNQPAEE